ncbi:hypothetical protein V8C34DRAFT_195904 [Trichoderma compactum]
MPLAFRQTVGPTFDLAWNQTVLLCAFLLSKCFKSFLAGRRMDGTARQRQRQTANGMVRYWANNKGRRFFLRIGFFFCVFILFFCFLERNENDA